MRKSLIIVLLCCSSVCYGAKNKTWNDGKLLSYDQQTFTTYSQNNGTGRDTPHTTYKIEIEASDRIYFAERTLNWRWQKFPHVTENGPVSWAMKGDNEIVIRDDRGKEFTLTIVKTRMK